MLRANRRGKVCPGANGSIFRELGVIGLGVGLGCTCGLKVLSAKTPHSGMLLSRSMLRGHRLPSSSNFALNGCGIMIYLNIIFFLEGLDVFLQGRVGAPEQVVGQSMSC